MRKIDNESLQTYAISAILILTAIGLAYGTRAASGHEATSAAGQPLGWSYPWACCSNMDCKMVDALAVSERPEGYVIESTGEVVAYSDKRVKDSPDGEYHWCAHQKGLDAGRTICLFVPPKGF
jgi:hypothetical protein